VKTRNITFNLPADLLQQAKIYSAEHDTTVNSLIRELLQEKLTREGRTRAAIDRLLAIAEHGPYFSIDLSTIRRDELHERR
jgi:plasmid stability protein